MSDYSAPRFALPGTWGRINLASDASVQSSIRKVVEHSIGRDDKLATLRADLRARFRQAADIARADSAVDFHVALQLAPGVPLPAWLAVFLPRIESTDFDALGLTGLKDVLQFGLTSVRTGEAAGRITVPKSEVHVVRQTFRSLRPATDDEPELQILRADYWLAATDPNRIALMTFSTNYVDLEEQMLELFDAVIGTVRWPAKAEQVA